MISVTNVNLEIDAQALPHTQDSLSEVAYKIRVLVISKENSNKTVNRETRE